MYTLPGLVLQEAFHMGTHWMQAGGIFPKIMDPYMNALPDQPLRKLRDPDAALEVVQILMLFIVWGAGITFGIIAFVAELGDENQSIPSFYSYLGLMASLRNLMIPCTEDANINAQIKSSTRLFGQISPKKVFPFPQKVLHYIKKYNLRPIICDALSSPPVLGYTKRI